MIETENRGMSLSKVVFGMERANVLKQVASCEKKA